MPGDPYASTEHNSAPLTQWKWALFLACMRDARAHHRHICMCVMARNMNRSARRAGQQRSSYTTCLHSLACTCQASYNTLHRYTMLHGRCIFTSQSSFRTAINRIILMILLLATMSACTCKAGACIQRRHAWRSQCSRAIRRYHLLHGPRSGALVEMNARQ